MITQKQVKHLFEYKNGSLTWKENHKRIKAGTVAGCISSNGYRKIGIKTKPYFAHRLVFLYHHGYLPEFIDHIDGNKLNNKIKNLRKATISQNCQNSKLSKTNTSGVKGISWDKVARKWRAKFHLKNKKIELGSFDDIDVAAQVIRISRLKYIGEFANHG